MEIEGDLLGDQGARVPRVRQQLRHGRESWSGARGGRELARSPWEKGRREKEGEADRRGPCGIQRKEGKKGALLRLTGGVRLSTAEREGERRAREGTTD